jgi:WD40 repeat protein
VRIDDETSIASQKPEHSDEFLRNFFIKFGMKKTLDSFQQEWFELKAKGQLDTSRLPQIPEIYRANGALSDELAVLQQDLDEARITAEKARSTYDKLRKQRDFQKINHRRVQQEKLKLNNDISKYKKAYEQNQETFKTLSTNYETAVKEKMLMKLEKDRLLAKLDNLESSLRQIEEQQLEETKDDAVSKKMDAVSKKSKQPEAPKAAAKTVAQPSVIPAKDRPNPLVNEAFEPVNSRMSMQKTFKGHLMGVTSLAYNPKKAIVATASDDTTWKMWTVPNGDLIMSGEGHLDWIGGLAFNPKGDLLATCSGDGTVKVWDFVNATCQHTFAEHGQPVWKVDFHDSGDFLLSCGMDHTVKLWDLNLGKSRFTYRGHVDSVNSVKFQPYSCMFVSGSGDKTVSLWDIRTNLGV